MFTKIGHFINETDLCSQKSVRCILDHFSTSQVGFDYWNVKRPVEFLNCLHSCRVFTANHNPITVKCIMNGRSLTQEFWSRDDFDRKMLDAMLFHVLFNTFIRADGSRTFGYDDCMFM